MLISRLLIILCAIETDLALMLWFETIKIQDKPSLMGYLLTL